MSDMNILNSTDVVYVGVDDTEIDLFESQYSVPQGMSYNSYIILDEKIAIIDTVDVRKCNEWLQNVEKALAGKTPDYLIVQHMEPDHSGCIAKIVQKYPSLTIVASAKAVQMLPQFFATTQFEGKTMAVKECDVLSLGKHSLKFITAPMVHWPEVIVSYDSSTKTLFSADAFGTFGVMNAKGNWVDEARRYYCNICGKYGSPVSKLLEKATTLDIETICPLHGPILQGELLQGSIRLYSLWSAYKPDSDGVFIAYASIHGGTKAVAEKMAEMLRQKGVKNLPVVDLCRTDSSEAVGRAFQMPKMIVASSSYDADVFSPMHDFLHRLQLKTYQNRTVGIIENGSWAPSAGRVMKSMFETMKNIELVEPMVTIKSRMKEDDFASLEQLAQALLC
jgi:flavorubredoxin